MESLFWLVLEAVIAVALLGLIVWWTLPRRKRERPRDPSQ
jgi:hypothetical protein